MKRLFLGVAIASAIGLTGCGGDTYDEIKEDTVPLIPESHIVFDPANGKMPLPNDLLFSGTTDGTLNIPGEESGDYTNPSLALGALDGWSTTSPISIEMEPANYHEGGALTLSAASVAQPGAVRMFEATVGGALSTDPTCADKASVSACKVGAELTYGVDFISQASGNNIVIVPLKPLKQNQSYIYLTTNLIQDSEGRAISPSSTYALLKLDITTHPLETPDQLALQTLVNSYEKGVASAHGVDKESISYSAIFTTQSIPDVYETNKLLMVDNSKPMNPYAPQLIPSAGGLPLQPLGITAAQMAGMTPETHGDAYVVASLADMHIAKIKLPVYGDCSSTACFQRDEQGNLVLVDGKPIPLVNGHWQALGDSPVSVLLALSAGTLSQTKFAEQAVAHGLNPTEALANPAKMAGFSWVLDNGQPADPTKHLTKFNPIVKIKNYETVDVLVALPNAARLKTFVEAQGKEFVAPTNGWPAVMALHGLGGGKEMALSYIGAYAAQGVATIAMDMPLHGSRSFDLNADGEYEVTATSPEYGAVIGQPNAFKNGDPLVFVNVASTLTVRDNFRQAISDHLAVRLTFTGLAMQLAQAGQPQIIDVTKISSQGLSLGAIVNTSLATYANTGLKNPADGSPLPNAYATQAASLVAPAGGLAGAFAGSATFGPVLFDTIVATPEFQLLVDNANTAGLEPGTPEYAALVQTVYQAFVPGFAFAVQTAIDSADPINQASMLTATQTPVHLIEVVGDGTDTNKPDQVLPNQVAGFPLSGTEPLISALGLGCVDGTKVGSGAVRFTKGHHSSIVSPSISGGQPTADELKATAEMQFEVSYFSSSAAAGQATVMVKDAGVVKACAQ
ncbi:lipase [Shewanella sp. NFH-SH190041]|uniref:VolA/Pla-1 family phospholipase n=1 Tax=Shewanella sp. NFH-SH190041 TaxID=2950245 RepID=UPI0021C47C85|nr:VolA/Pla-1 family phospholipase [Shewanella sp. NFH-SH190041]BDM64988.1 lipase [Shewanella sp. NFH-SH190041]